MYAFIPENRYALNIQFLLIPSSPKSMAWELFFSIGLKSPPLVEDPDRFYRSGEKSYRFNLQENPNGTYKRKDLCIIIRVYHM
jgi:hypothetical protein